MSLLLPSAGRSCGWRAAAAAGSTSTAATTAGRAASAASTSRRLRGWGPLLRGDDLLPKLGKHCRGAAARAFLNDVVGFGVQIKSRVRARQPVGHPALIVIELG